MTATTISPELTAHLTTQALKLEQLADSIQSGVIDPTMLAPRSRSLRSPLAGSWKVARTVARRLAFQAA